MYNLIISGILGRTRGKTYMDLVNVYINSLVRNNADRVEVIFDGYRV